MASQLFTVYGVTDGVALTGIFPLASQLFYTATEEYIQIPRGMKLKIWSMRVSGGSAVAAGAQNTDVTTMVGYNMSVAVPAVPIGIDSLDVGVEARYFEDYKRPIVIEGFTGMEGVSFEWTQLVIGVTHVKIECELTDEN